MLRANNIHNPEAEAVATKPTEYVWFSRGVNDQTMHELIITLREISTRSAEVHLLINSNGGNVHAGIHCYTMMRSLPITLITYNVGHIDSIANVLFLAGEKRYCAPTSIFLFHSVGFDFNSPTRLDGRQFREYLDSVEADHTRIGDIISSRSLLERSKAREFFDVQRVYDANWAKDKGIVHEISNLQLEGTYNISMQT